MSAPRHHRLDEGPVLCRVDDQVAYITLNRPPHNAIDLELCLRLQSVCRELAADDDVAAVVLAGSGTSFCAGGDIKWMSTKRTPDEWRPMAHDVLHGAMNAVAALPMPVMASVHGHVLGGGLELALACDWIMASDDAIFGFPEVQLGIFPGAGGSQRLPRRVPVSAARRMMLTGRRIGAREAQALGLVAHVLPAADLWDAVTADLDAIRSAGRHAVRVAKRMVDDGLETPLRQALRAEADAIALLFGTEEQQQRFDDFLNRRRED